MSTFGAVCIAAAAAVNAAAADLPPPKQGGVYVIAHRGAHEGIPENTLAAYRKSIELGCDFVEIDIRTTRDGRFVSIHNDDVDDYCVDGTTGKVKDFTLAELKALDIGSRFGSEWTDERIPTFEEILDLCAGKIGIYLDLKDAPVPALADLVKQHDMEHRTVWYAGWNRLEELQDICAGCIPMPDPGPEKNLDRVLERFQPTIVASVWKYYSAAFVQTCHDADALVFVDESDPSCWPDAIAWHSDGIQTDHPAALIKFLDARN